MYECFHCGARAVIWDADFDTEDYGYEPGGIVHDCHCENCGAQIQYFIWPDEEDEGEETEGEEAEDQEGERIITVYDQEETHPNCTVQILRNSLTGEESVGWWDNKEE